MLPEDTSQAGAQQTSLSLLVRLRSGESESWSFLVRLYGPLVYSWCRRAGLDVEDASDAVQDVFTTVSTHLESFRRDRPGDSFRKWLKTIAYNCARTHQRKQAGAPQAEGGTHAQVRLNSLAQGVVEEPPQTFGDDDESEQRQLLRQTTELVRGDFTPVTWQAFWETAVCGRAAPDVAADLGITANAVRIAKSRIRARLREELDGLLE